MRRAPTAPSPIAPPPSAANPPAVERPEAPRPGSGRAWRAWLGVLISVGFLVYAFQGQDLGEVWATLRAFDLRWLPPALLLYFAGVGVRAVRWSVLLRPVVAVPPRSVLPIVVAGYTANNILPLRTGELVRAYLLGRRFGVRKTAALATIAVERLFDGLTMLAFVLAATTAISFTAELRRLALVAFLLFAAVLAGLVALTLGGDLRDRLLQLALGPLPTPLADRIGRVAESFLGGLGVLTRRTDLALVAGTSLIAWGLEASVYWTIARGFDATVADAIGPAAALLTTGVANLWTMIPAAPGYVGTFHTGVVLALDGALGVPSGLALSYAILVHAALWFPITLWGAIEWWRQHLSFGQARDAGALAVEDDAAGKRPTRQPGGDRPVRGERAAAREPEPEALRR